jgi:CBS domain containing-hemolysin-like protein
MMHDLGSEKIMHDPDKTLSDILKPITFVEEEEDCLAMLTLFLKKRRHIAIVHDEYGGVSGLVTLEDLLETVLGAEIVDETDKDIDMQKVALRLNKNLKP